MLVLGIDPGTAITGYGIVRAEGDALEAVAYGAITTSANQPLEARLQQLYTELLALIETFRPVEASVEELFFAKNARTALTVGHARGVILLALANTGVAVFEYTPLQVKQTVTGYGRADKEQMQHMVRLLCNLDDAADALALAICHVNSRALADLVRRSEGEHP